MITTPGFVGRRTVYGARQVTGTRIIIFFGGYFTRKTVIMYTGNPSRRMGSITRVYTHKI